MRREAHEIWIDAFIAVLLAIGCFSFFQFYLPYHLFLKEQTQLFLFTADYFLSYFDKPAWLACYFADYLTQFFYLRGGGAIIITCTLLLEWWLLTRVFRSLEIEKLAVLLALLPVIAEWIQFCGLSYTLASPVSVIIILFCFLGYIKISNKLLSLILGMIMIPVLYSLAGVVTLFFFLLVFTYQVRRSRDWWYGIILVILASIFPFFIRHHYLLTEWQAYQYPYFSFNSLWPVYICLPILLLSFARKVRVLKLSLISFWSIIGLSLLLLSIGVFSKADFKRERILALASEVYFENWDRANQFIEANKQNNRIATYYTNIVLSQQNELPDRLLEFYQPASLGLFLPVDPQSTWLTIFFSSDVYYHLGDMNMTQHSAMLGQIFSPKYRSSRMTKRLAEVNLVNGDTTAARKYLRILDKTLFHRKWAEQRERILSGSDSVPPLWLQAKRSQIPVRNILRTSSDHVASLKLLLESNPDNMPALNYLLCYFLLNKDIPSFMTIFDTYWKGKISYLPRVYGEALLIRLASVKASEKVLQSYGISNKMITDFMNYTSIYEQGNGEMEPLREDFVSSYWFYYHFAQMRE